MTNYSTLEKQVFDFLNKVRQNPTCILEDIQFMKKSFKSGCYQQQKNGQWFKSHENDKAWKDALEFLKRQKPLPVLSYCQNLQQSAQKHFSLTAKSGKFGHLEGTNSIMERMKQIIKNFQGLVGENLAYGKLTAKQIVINLIIDDGVPSRGHRANIFSKSFDKVGICCEEFKNLEQICIMDFSGSSKKIQIDKNVSKFSNKENWPKGTVQHKQQIKMEQKNNQKITTIENIFITRDGQQMIETEIFKENIKQFLT